MVSVIKSGTAEMSRDRDVWRDMTTNAKGATPD